MHPLNIYFLSHRSTELEHLTDCIHSVLTEGVAPDVQNKWSFQCCHCEERKSEEVVYIFLSSVGITVKAPTHEAIMTNKNVVCAMAISKILIKVEELNFVFSAIQPNLGITKVVGTIICSIARWHNHSPMSSHGKLIAIRASDHCKATSFGPRIHFRGYDHHRSV